MTDEVPAKKCVMRVSFVDLLYVYPILSSLISNTEMRDLYSLVQTSKEIYALLHPNEGSWGNIRSKAIELQCKYKHNNEYKGTGVCIGQVVTCIGCRKGICSGRSMLDENLSYLSNRVRQPCADCLTYGYNPVLTNRTAYFDAHTRRMLEGGRVWYERAIPQTVLQNPDLDDEDDVDELSSTIYVHFDPKSYFKDGAYDIRNHTMSRCICEEAKKYIPLCTKCFSVAEYRDLQYAAWVRQNVGVCECGVLLWNMDGADGATLTPQLQSQGLDTSYLERIQAENKDKEDVDRTALWGGFIPFYISNARETRAGSAGSTYKDVCIGLCSLCGFRVYKEETISATPAQQPGDTACSRATQNLLDDEDDDLFDETEPWDNAYDREVNFVDHQLETDLQAGDGE